MKRAALIVAVVLATHLTYEHYSNGDFYFPDSATYLTPARSLLHGQGFTTDGEAETLRTPGYPLFLLPFLALRAPDGAIVFVQHLLIALLAAAIYLRTRNAVGPLVLAFDLITIHFANKVLTEALSAIIVYAIFSGATRFSASSGALKRAAPLGLLCGALVLVRPVAIAYFAVVTFWLVFVRMRPRAIATFVAAALVLPLGWATRNRIETGHFTISPVGALNLLMHRAAGALAMEDGGDFDEAHEKRMDELQKIVNQRIREGEEQDPNEVSSADVAPYYSEVARPILIRHWRGTILVTLRGFFVNMFDTDWKALRIVTTVNGTLVENLVIAWTWLLWIATIAGLAMMWRRDREAALLIAATIVYFLFMAAGGEAEGRFRAPVIPLMAVAVTSLFRSPLRYSTSRPTASRASRRTESR